MGSELELALFTIKEIFKTTWISLICIYQQGILKFFLEV